jgi:hypothetical protein
MGSQYRNSWFGLALLVACVLVGGSANRQALADENGISFWLPGMYGSMAATPLSPGLSVASVYYHTSVSASGAAAAQREIAVGRLSRTANLNLDVNLHADVDINIINPIYVVPTPVWGGQLAIGVAGVVGRNKTSVEGTLDASIGTLSRGATRTLDSSVTGFGDLFPQASLRWNMGVHNVMTYVTGDIPVGSYESTRLANLGIGHGAVDAGAGYTYFNPATGREFSAVTGVTYNFKNTSTDYQNGIDWHLDWGVSQFLNKQFFVGAVGYFYAQLTEDSGQAAFLGANQSKVIGIGPQVGLIFPVGDMEGYLNLKGYHEFASYRRPEGWNTWLTFVISPAPPEPKSRP